MTLHAIGRVQDTDAESLKNPAIRLQYTQDDGQCVFDDAWSYVHVPCLRMHVVVVVAFATLVIMTANTHHNAKTVYSTELASL